MALHHCGIIPIGKKEGNVSLFCPDLNTSRNNSEAEPTFDLVIELYLITFLCLVGIVGNILSIVVLRRDHERMEAMILLQVSS